MQRNLLKLPVLLFLSFFFAMPTQAQTIHLDLTGLEDLGPNFVYEGWLIGGGPPSSAGTFTVDSAGIPSQNLFNVGAALDNASSFLITIEPFIDPDPSPSTNFLAGDLMGGVADLTVGHGLAFGDDFLSATGSFILGVPTTDPADSVPYTQGIWWLDPAGPSTSLNLPTLPAGWEYEGWVVGPGGPVSTGRFTDPESFDSDGGGPAAGPNPGPPFPGQDFVNPATNLIGYEAFISIEPTPDNSSAPFTLRPLVDSNIEDVGEGVLQTTTNNAASFPTARVSAVPEPSGLLIAFLGLTSVGLGRRRRQ